MFVSNEVLERVAQVLGGEDAVKIVRVLRKVEDATDDELASKTDVRLNQVRRILYRLYDFSLVTCDRIRDESTGWFIFHWSLQPDQAEGFIQNQKRKILEKLTARLEYETSHEFYSCSTPNCNRVTFEDAVELIFRCPKCGKPLEHSDNTDLVESLNERIKSIQEGLSG